VFDPVLNKNLMVAVVLGLCLAFSIYAGYRLQAVPTERVEFVPSFKYTHKAEYEYGATLWPSILYDNRTVLMPGDVPYIPLVHMLNVSLTYSFSTDPVFEEPSNLSYMVYSVLEAPNGWKKIFPLTPVRRMAFNSSNMGFTERYTFNITRIVELIRAIEDETETWFPVYYLRVVAEVNASVQARSDVIADSFKPIMTVKLAFSEGNKLLFEGLNSEKSRTVGEYVVSEVAWVKNMRYISYASSVFLAVALAYALRLYLVNRSPISPVQKAMRKHRDIIVESTKFGMEKGGRTVIEVKSIEDLTKISEDLLLKPIIHEEDPETRQHVFYILDGDVRYEYRVKKAEVKPAKPKPQEASS